MTTPDPILITGATGSVGPYVVGTLHAAGYRIRTFSLHPPLENSMPQDVEVRIGNILDKEAVKTAMEGIHSVIHMAAMLHIVDPSQSIKIQARKVNAEGTATVVACALRSGVKRIVYFSTIAVYGHSKGGILTEDSLVQPDSEYARAKLEGEKIVLAARGSDGSPIGTVLRLSAVYGSSMKGNYLRLVRSLARRKFIPIGDGRNRRTLIYAKDVGRAALMSVRNPNTVGEIYNLTDGCYHTMKDIIGHICAALGRRPPYFSLPLRPARLAADMMEGIARLLRTSFPIGLATIDKYTDDLAVSGERIRKVLDFVPVYDIQKGWTETIEEMRRSGKL